MEKEFDRILETRTIEVYGEIYPHRVAVWIAALQLLCFSKHPVTVMINSPGGDGKSTELFCNNLIGLSRLGTPVVTRITGLAASAACLIALAGQHREAFSDCKLLVHFGVIHCFANSVQSAMEFVESQREEVLRMAREMAEYVAGRTNLSVKECCCLCLEDRQMNADEALRLGFIDKIL